MKRTRIKPVNSARRSKASARNFGARGEAVRAMGCLSAAAFADRMRPTVGGLHSARPCAGDVQACHVIARGMGGTKGDRRHLVPLCARHHDEAGEGSWKPEQPSKRAAFEARYGLNLKVEAERVAVELDGRGLS